MQNILNRICPLQQCFNKSSISLTVPLSIGRLSKEDIERMVQEAEQYKAADDVQRDKVA
jgi:molecular chaperone DnaK (HSP70)